MGKIMYGGVTVIINALIYLCGIDIFKIWVMLSGIICVFIFIVQNKDDIDLKNGLMWCFGFLFIGFLSLPYFIMYSILNRGEEENG